MRHKVTVIGAGFVGSTLVQRLAERDYADVVMFDIIPNMPQGKALDMLQAGPVLGYDSLVTGTNDYADTANSDIVVITSGFPRKPGMSRDDLVKKNQEIITQVTEQVVKYSPNSIIIMVTNPL
ncbi:MAG TPA: malate dehydrogenase, partial [Ktedonobacteraceae bacterium]